MSKYSTQGILKTFILLVFFSLCALQTFTQKRFGVHLSGHYGYHSFTSDEEREEGEKGRVGNGIEFRYVLGNQSKTLSTSIGVGYTRFGFARSFQWTDSTPEREESYGIFPISYEMWDDYHYISFPFYLNVNADRGWKMSVSGSLDYPIGASYFRERSSADQQVIETNKDGFDAGKAYPFNTSIGASVLIGKSFPLSEKIDFLIESQFKMYTLLAARSNDYFPHRESVRPYTIGLVAGLRF